MDFSFALSRPTTLPAASYRQEEGPLEDEEDYGYLVIRGCAALAETDAAFRIGGFGTADWGFDVSYDFSAFMESLADLTEALRSGTEAEVDLYPQGLERTLRFRPSGRTVSIECLSRTAWTPVPAVEVCPRDALLSMCARLCEDFARSLAAIGSDVATLSPFREWASGRAGAGRAARE